MGRVETEITLVNEMDAVDAKRGYISADKVRKESIRAVVDTGATSLVITEELFAKLGLSKEGVINATLADGRKMPCTITSGIILHCQNREILVQAVVIPGAAKTLLGVFALEALDFMIDPVNQTLVGVHGDEMMFMAY
jgi:clan AA aspartic protease